jgi:hypothetical protein
MIDRAKYLERQRRYNASEKGRARWRRYGTSPKGLESRARYEDTHPRVSMFGQTHRVPAGFAARAIQLREERYEQQRAAYRKWRDEVLVPEVVHIPTHREIGASPYLIS